ncbi:hypothetical protein TNCV_2636121 [Trichonephila clavipes]|nr:hypothetical protein TNCV_2636121 [Trichonephila clavipes]
MRFFYSLAFRSSPGDLAVGSFDFVLDFDCCIVLSSAPAAAFGDPGVWTAACSVNSGCTGLLHHSSLNRTGPPWACIFLLDDLEPASLVTLFLSRRWYGPVSLC